MIRSDCTAFGMSSNNMSVPSPLEATTMISLIDFTKSPPLNTLVTYNALNSKPSCYTGPGSWLPPMQSTFLRDVGAVFAGTESTPEYGICDKWLFTIPSFGEVIFVFYFDQAFQNLVRYDFNVPHDPVQINVGVTTKFFNIVSGNKTLFPATIFAGSGSCSSDSIPLSPEYAHLLSGTSMPFP
jgi:hypothetical protein